MDKLKRPVVWIPIAVAVLVLVLGAGVLGTYLAMKPKAEDKGFIARGTISAMAMGIDGFTPAARSCVITTRDGFTVKAGIPVTITLDGEAVGTGQLPIGQYDQLEPTGMGGSCDFPIAIPVSKTAEAGATYRVELSPDIGTTQDLEALKSGAWILAL